MPFRLPAAHARKHLASTKPASAFSVSAAPTALDPDEPRRKATNRAVRTKPDHGQPRRPVGADKEPRLPPASSESLTLKSAEAAATTEQGPGEESSAPLAALLQAVAAVTDGQTDDFGVDATQIARARFSPMPSWPENDFPRVPSNTQLMLDFSDELSSTDEPAVAMVQQETQDVTRDSTPPESDTEMLDVQDAAIPRTFYDESIPSVRRRSLPRLTSRRSSAKSLSISARAMSAMPRSSHHQRSLCRSAPGSSRCRTLSGAAAKIRSSSKRPGLRRPPNSIRRRRSRSRTSRSRRLTRPSKPEVGARGFWQHDIGRIRRSADESRRSCGR